MKGFLVWNDPLPPIPLNSWNSGFSLYFSLKIVAP